jgi:hypothetical protein
MNENEENNDDVLLSTAKLTACYISLIIDNIISAATK